MNAHVGLHRPNRPSISSPTAPGVSSAHAPELDLPARFMLLGTIVLTLVAVLGPWSPQLLLGGFYDPRLLAFVHLNTLGVIGAVIVGASYQLVPVILQVPLVSTRLGRVSFWCYLGGIAGFLPGMLLTCRPALVVGGTLLTVAFALYVGLVGATLARAPHRGVVAWHIGAALFSLTVAVGLGLALAVNKGTDGFGTLGLRLLAAHATLMLGGWVTVMLTGVSYRLVGMFTLAEDALWTPGAWLELVLATGGSWLLALSLATGAGPIASLVGAGMLLAGLALFLGQLYRLYRRRRRPGLDVHAPFALTAAALGVGGATLLVVGFAGESGPSSSLWIVAGWLAIAGVAETAIQGFFYKIATFLVWLRCYAPLAGRRRVPRLEDLYSRFLALVGWAFWTLGVVLTVAAVAMGSASLSRIAGVSLAVGLGCFLANVLRIGAHRWHALAQIARCLPGLSQRGDASPESIPSDVSKPLTSPTFGRNNAK